MKRERELAELHALAAGLAHDASIGFDLLADRWCWRPSTRTVFASGADLERLGVDACAPFIAHEVGHALVSRYAHFRDRGTHAPVVRSLLNVLEDARVEHFVARRFVGVRPWLEALKVRERDEVTPPAPGVTLPLIDAFLWEGAVLAGLAPCAPSVEPQHELVPRILDATREARRRYVLETLPDPSLRDAPDDALQRYLDEVAPHLDPSVPDTTDRLEAWIRVLARRAFLLVREQILPHVGEAIDADVRAVARLLARSEELQRDVRKVIDAGEFAWAHRLVRGAWQLPPAEQAEPVGAEELQLARRVVDGWLREVCGRGRDELDPGRDGPPANAGELDRCAGGATTASRGASWSWADASRLGALDDRELAERPAPGDAVDDDASSWMRCDGMLSDTADLLAELRASLPERAHTRRRRHADRGISLDLRAAMAASARHGSPERVWRRRSAPDRARAAFLLLVDLSGSMRGEPVLQALRAARVFAEALTELALPCSIVGFQDECIEVLPFDAPFDERARARLASCVDEPAGTRIGGRNQFRYNDDGPCLREAARALLARPEPDRVLIVLSDGHPEGRRSNEEDLSDAVRALSEAITLIGIGVGARADHVRSIYPHSVPNVPLHQLTRHVGRILRSTLA